MQTKTRRWLTGLLPLVGLVMFAWIVRGTGVDRILGAFGAVDPMRLLVFPVFTVFVAAIRGLRWRALMGIAGIDYPFGRSTYLWAMGFFAASVTPAKAGDVMRAFYLSRDTGHNVGECFATVFADRVMDLVIVLVAGVVTILFFSYRYIHVGSAWVFVLASAVVFGGIILLMRREVVRAFVGPLFRALSPEKYQAELSRHFHSFYDALNLYARNKRRTFAAFILALVFWAGVVVLAWTVTWVLALRVSFGYVLVMMPVVTLVELIPISVSGLGTREAAVIYFFSVIGIGGAGAVSFSILYLLAGTYLTALAGLVAWGLRPKRLKRRLVD